MLPFFPGKNRDFGHANRKIEHVCVKIASIQYSTDMGDGTRMWSYCHLRLTGCE